MLPALTRIQSAVWSLPSATCDPPHVMAIINIMAPGWQAHHSGLVCAAGGEVGVITVSTRGTVMLWPEAELRSMSEAAGFVLPDADGEGAGNADDGLPTFGRPLTISDVRTAGTCVTVLGRAEPVVGCGACPCCKICLVHGTPATWLCLHMGGC